MWQGILTTLSQSNGHYTYDYGTVPFLAEFFKVYLFMLLIKLFILLNYVTSSANTAITIELQLVVSSLLLWRERRVSPSTRMTTEWKSVRLFVVPSVIYLFHNNVQFATLTYVDTSTYQIMGNLKIVTTGILFRCLHCIFFDVT